MLTKKQWIKKCLKGLIAKELPRELKLKRCAKDFANDFYGILSPGEVVEEADQIFEELEDALYLKECADK